MVIYLLLNNFYFNSINTIHKDKINNVLNILFFTKEIFTGSVSNYCRTMLSYDTFLGAADN